MVEDRESGEVYTSNSKRKREAMMKNDSINKRQQINSFDNLNFGVCCFLLLNV
jgi:hypothetical protein